MPATYCYMTVPSHCKKYKVLFAQVRRKHTAQANVLTLLSTVEATKGILSLCSLTAGVSTGGYYGH